MEIIVGRKGQQPFAITDKSVSGKHLKLIAMPDGNVQVEDLCSSNGTFIDDVRIIKKIVPRNALIRMGSNYTFKVSDIFPETPKTTKSQQQGTPAPVAKQVPEVSITHLENVWNQYFVAKNELDNQNRNIGLMRSASPMLAFIPGLTAVLGTYSFFKAKKFNYNEAIEEVKETFEDNYCCPNCHHFLGYVKYKLLIQDDSCRYCKCKWIVK